LEAHGGRKPTLKELQLWLRDRFTGRPSPEADWSAVIVDEPPLARQARLDIYANAYFWRLLESLSDDFEATGKAITWLESYDRFSLTAREYFRAHPSRTADIREAGRSFPAFLRGHEIASRAPWLGELASLEWLYLESFLAAHPKGLSPSALARLSEKGEAVKLTFSSSVRFFASGFPVLGLWRKRLGARKLDFPARPRAQWLLIRRTLQGGVAVTSISEPAFRLLEALREGETLGEACASIAASISDPSVLSVWFQRWVGEGLFADVS
jgi:hypothetical protein